jgi:hypothetical protein
VEAWTKVEGKRKDIDHTFKSKLRLKMQSKEKKGF